MMEAGHNPFDQKYFYRLGSTSYVEHKLQAIFGPEP